jgi:hypothetical protein
MNRNTAHGTRGLAATKTNCDEPAHRRATNLAPRSVGVHGADNQLVAKLTSAAWQGGRFSG